MLFTFLTTLKIPQKNCLLHSSLQAQEEELTCNLLSEALPVHGFLQVEDWGMQGKPQALNVSLPSTLEPETVRK